MTAHATYATLGSGIHAGQQDMGATQSDDAGLLISTDLLHLHRGVCTVPLLSDSLLMEEHSHLISSFRPPRKKGDANHQPKEEEQLQLPVGSAKECVPEHRRKANSHHPQSDLQSRSADE